MDTFVLRPATDADWPAILDVAHAAVPWAPAENEEWLHNRQRFDHARRHRCHYVAEEPGTGQVVAYGAAEEGPEPGWYRLFVVTPPQRLADLGETLYRRLWADLGERAARRTWVQEEVLDPVVGFFQARGFSEYRRFRLDNGRDAVVLFRDLVETVG